MEFIFTPLNPLQSKMPTSRAHWEQSLTRTWKSFHHATAKATLKVVQGVAGGGDVQVQKIKDI